MPAVREAVARALAEDLLPMGDITAALIPVDVQVRAEIIAREEGVLAGRLCVNETFAQVDPAVVVTWSLDDGEELEAGAHIASVEGPLPSVLSAERTALNFLCHLSGVASTTRRFVRAAAGQARIRDTRKTTPGLRALEKAAVAAGGATNHRFGLFDAILIKENHAALAGGVGEAVRKARAHASEVPLEVECRTLEEVDEALTAGAPQILLDNMTTDQLRQAVERVGGRAHLEASGGVTIETLGEIAATGVNFISVGALTHSAPALDLSLILEPV